MSRAAQRVVGALFALVLSVCLLAATVWAARPVSSVQRQSPAALVSPAFFALESGGANIEVIRLSGLLYCVVDEEIRVGLTNIRGLDNGVAEAEVYASVEVRIVVIGAALGGKNVCALVDKINAEVDADIVLVGGAVVGFGASTARGEQEQDTPGKSAPHQHSKRVAL